MASGGDPHLLHLASQQWVRLPSSQAWERQETSGARTISKLFIGYLAPVNPDSDTCWEVEEKSVLISYRKQQSKPPFFEVPSKWPLQSNEFNLPQKDELFLVWFKATTTGITAKATACMGNSVIPSTACLWAKSMWRLWMPPRCAALWANSIFYDTTHLLKMPGPSNGENSTGLCVMVKKIAALLNASSLGWGVNESQLKMPALSCAAGWEVTFQPES